MDKKSDKIWKNRKNRIKIGENVIKNRIKSDKIGKNLKNRIWFKLRFHSSIQHCLHCLHCSVHTVYATYTTSTSYSAHTTPIAPTAPFAYTVKTTYTMCIYAKNVWCCGEGYFCQKKIAEKVRKSRQNVNRDKSA